MHGYLSPPDAPHAAEVFEAKAQLARVTLLGHDLRAAVSDILGGLRLLSHEALPAPVQMQLERMRVAGEDVARLLEEGLEIVTAQTLEPLRRSVRLARLLYDIEMRWAGRAQERGMRFHFALAPDVPTVVMLDRVALERALSNMLSNAFKYSFGGAVRLLVHCEPEGRLGFIVLDDGPGFAPGAEEALFAPGARECARSEPQGPSPEGSGLGLFIAQEMAARLQGRFEIGNRAEGGAWACLSVPLEGLQPPEATQAPPLPDLTGMRALVVDDSAVNRAVLAHMLTTMGAETETAADGAAALERLGRGPVDLLVLDIEMPGLTGLEVMARLREGAGRAVPQVPIVACTAYVLRANREAILAAGADAVLCKPLQGISPLGEAVRHALTRPQPPSDAVPIIDTAVFDALLALGSGLEPARILEHLLTDLGRIERSLVAGLSRDDLERLRADAHALVAIAGSVGATRLHQLAQHLGDAVQEADLATVRLLGPRVLSLTDRLIHFAASRLTGTPGERGAE